MNIAEQIGIYVFATVLGLPFHLIVASPWLLATWAAAVATRRYLNSRSRFILASGIAALGLAPAYGAHLSMLPIYTLVISGDAELVTAAVSFVTTWSFILLVGLTITLVRSHKKPLGCNPPQP